MRKLLLFAVAIVASLGMMNAQTTVTITDSDLQGNQTYDWTKDKTYILDGLVYLEDGSILNIEPGTVIKGKETPTSSDNTSSLVITRGATINADGTSTDPIIFTSEADQLNGNLLPSDCGKWGGLILLGKAPVYSDGNTEVSIEGIDASEPRGKFGGNQPGDNSGTLKYVSIRHSGVGIAPGSEIQGLTLGGVGNGTTIEYVEVYSSCDDGIEIFGGTAEIRHFSVAWATDDSYDLDVGWRGNGQYLFAIQQSGTGDAYDKAGEWDGAKPDDASLYSKPDIANMTLIGPGQNATGAQNALVMRDAWGGTLYNSIITDFPGVGIEVEDLNAGIDAYARLDSNIIIANNTWGALGDASTTDELVKISDNPTEANASTLKTHLSNNSNDVVAGEVVAGISRIPNSNGLDPRPNANYQNTATVPAALNQESYRGAFDPQEDIWLKGWSALDAYGFLGDLVSVGINDLEDQGYKVDNIAPNPADKVARVQISVPEATSVQIMVSDVTGRMVKSENFGTVATGTYNTNLDVSQLNAGIYFITMNTEKGQITQKLVVK